MSQLCSSAMTRARSWMLAKVQVPALLYLSPSTSPVQVGVVFDPSGRIGGIMDSRSVFYISRSEYKKLKVDMDYDAMLSNDTAQSSSSKLNPERAFCSFRTS